MLGRLLSGLARQRGVLVFVLSLVNGLVVTSILIVVTTPDLRAAWGGVAADPGAALSSTWDFLGEVYGTMLTGAFGDPTDIGRALTDPSRSNVIEALSPLAVTLTAATPLAVAGVGLAVAFRSGVFNIGSISQVIAGGIGASLVGFGLAGLPWALHVLLALVAAAVAGALCASVPGVIKAATGGSEVIVTIMMNYTASLVLVYLLSSTFFQAPGGDAPVGRRTAESASLVPLIDGLPLDAGVLLALVVAAVVATLLNRSRLGFVLQMAGLSPRAAAMAGVDGRRVVLTSFAISGAVIALAGAIMVLGSQRQLTPTFGVEVGTMALLVAFVGQNRPWWILLAALFFGAMQSGGLLMQFTVGVSNQLTAVMQAVIVMFITAPALVASIYRLRLDRREVRS